MTRNQCHMDKLSRQSWMLVICPCNDVESNNGTLMFSRTLYTVTEGDLNVRRGITLKSERRAWVDFYCYGSISNGQRFGSNGQRFGSNGQRFGSNGQQFGSNGQRFGSNRSDFIFRHESCRCSARNNGLNPNRPNTKGTEPIILKNDAAIVSDLRVTTADNENQHCCPKRQCCRKFRYCFEYPRSWRSFLRFRYETPAIWLTVLLFSLLRSVRDEN